MAAVGNRARRQRIHQNRIERRRGAGVAVEQTSTRPARDKFAGNFCRGRRTFGIRETLRRGSRRRRHGRRRCPTQVSFVLLNRTAKQQTENQGIRSETLYQFHSQVLPLSGENAWLHTGRSLFRTSQRNIMIIGFPLNVSLQKKWPTLFSNEPSTGGSITPELLATQYKLHNLVFGLNSRSVRPSKCLPSWPGISVVE